MLSLSGCRHILLSLLQFFYPVASYGVYIFMFLELLMGCDSSLILGLIRSLLSVCLCSWPRFSVLLVGECMCLLYILCALFVDFKSVYLGL